MIFPRCGTSTAGSAGRWRHRFTIGVMVDSADEVDRLTEQMRAADARVTKEPVDADLHRPLALPLRPRRQLLRDRLGRHAEQPRPHRSPPSRRRLNAHRISPAGAGSGVSLPISWKRWQILVTSSIASSKGVRPHGWRQLVLVEVE